MSYFKEDEKYKWFLEEPKKIEPLLSDNMLLIVGDFYGIQKFIFERLSTKNASKVLRAKSAFIQIFTEYLARYICSEFKVSQEAILSMSAGKFEILISEQEVDLDAIQRKFDNYFVKNFYGLSGVILSLVKCNRDDFKNYRGLRQKIKESIEEKKFQKFSLQKENAFSLLAYESNIDNNSLCKVCNIRKVEKGKSECSVCYDFIELGKKLSFEHIDELVQSCDLGIAFDDDFNIEIKLTQKIKSYVLFVEDETHKFKLPADFDYLSKASCDGLDKGLEALAILKADVDNMGTFLEKSSVAESFESFDEFSRNIDNFFSLYIPKIMREHYPHSYVVFAGGDDLFLLGAWSEVLEMARSIEKEFKAFVKSELTLSFGIAIAKPTTPISYLANHTEELLEASKEIDEEKDALTLFGETVKWCDYNEVYKKLYNRLTAFESDLNTAFLYRLLELIAMSKKVKYEHDIPSTMWKSKFRYSFNRNVLEKTKEKENALNMLELLSGLMEENPKETKMIVSEFIYKRREA